jgi:SAM-dependent methyltransferase
MEYDWDKFLGEKVKAMFTERKKIIDIGGGLRISREKGNRFDPKREWMAEYAQKADYLIMEPEETYHPDLVGDIHSMPFEDGSVDGIICLSVLEHVENPFKACSEMYRVLKKGGQALVFVPFLFYYHPFPGYYKDYWRFTIDGIKLLFADYSSIETQNVRGAWQTWINFTPLNRYEPISQIAAWADRITGKDKSNQVSGYYIYLIK